MNQKVIDKVSDIFLNTNFASKFAWPGLFKAQAYLLELKTDKFTKWFNSLGLPFVDNIYINAIDSAQDKEILYSGAEAKSLGGWGAAVSRSIAIPAFIDNRPYFDGGVGFNPPLYQWEHDDIPIFVSQLMMPYRMTPKGRLESLFYSWEFSSFQKYQFVKEKFDKRVTTFYPMVNDVSSVDFGISKDIKQQMLTHSENELRQQFEFYFSRGDLKRPENPTPVYVALSGGGIRSGAHISFIKLLMEYNYQPIAFSGTSGGSAFAVMFGGFAELLKDV